MSAVLKPKTQDKTRTLSIRLPADLLTEIDAIRAEADQRGLLFDVTEIAAKSLSAALKQARQELNRPPT